MDMEIDVDMKRALRAFEMILNPKQRKLTMRQVKTAGAGVIRVAAKKALKAPLGAKNQFFYNRSGALRDSLSTAKKGLYKSRKTSNVWVVAGGKRTGAPHAHLVEFGHNSRRNGPVAGVDFMSKTAEKHAEAARKKAIEKFKKSIKARVEKQGLKYEG